VTIRGVSTDRLQAASIAYVVDGVPYGDTEFFTTRLFDVLRIEVVRGPQGALFGKSAAGGAFNIISAAPTAAAGGYVRAGLGSGFARELEAAATGELARGVTARLAVFAEATDGQIENRTLGRTVDDYATWNARGADHGGAAGRSRPRARARPALTRKAGPRTHPAGTSPGQTGGRLSEGVLEEPIGDYLGPRVAPSGGRAQARSATERTGGRRMDADARTTATAKQFEEELDYRPRGRCTVFGFPVPDRPSADPPAVSLEVATGEARYVVRRTQRRLASSPACSRRMWSGGGWTTSARCCSGRRRRRT
jgi:outer membrane receptor protein involved in Fe transport